jgi:aminodeoxyfutalosine deaminase
MSLSSFIAAMPKVELHVHLEGATRPETLLTLAQRHNITLPANTVEGLREWFVFRDFPHFVDIYVAISDAIRTYDDLELITREFFMGQAEQNIRHTEFTYTPYTHAQLKGWVIEEQLAALNRARAWASAEYGMTSGMIWDIAREVDAEKGLITAQWVRDHYGDGVIALGFGGYEVGHPVEKHTPSFELMHTSGVPCILHAGETGGADSIWGAIKVGNTQRIGHGVRCLEDASLVEYLRREQIPLEVNPTSNVRLGVAPSLAEHPLPRLMAEGLYVTVNSDDPPMFNTTLTQEYQMCAETFGWDVNVVERLVMNAVGAAMLPPPQKAEMARTFAAEFARLRPLHL